MMAHIICCTAYWIARSKRAIARQAGR